MKFESSIFSAPIRGEGGRSSYRGNCCPQIIEAFIGQYDMKYLSDYAIGGGTTRDVCKKLGVKGVWTDLSMGFDLMTNEIPDCPENIFFHPPYWNMNNKIIYSNTEYDWQKVMSQYGYDPRQTDMSQAPTWESFIGMLNYAIMKQFSSLQKGGRFGILMGDIKNKGKLSSMLLSICKPGTIENVIIKNQYNCQSGRTKYSGSFIPTDHEYFLILKKDAPFILDFQVTKTIRLDIRDSKDATWKDVVMAVLNKYNGAVTLDEIYSEVGQHKKASQNIWWKEKIRQSLQLLRDKGYVYSEERGKWAKMVA